MKKALTVISAVLVTFIVFPIWYYLFYKILIAVNATELMWFLYWIYLPAHLIATLIAKIINKEDE